MSLIVIGQQTPCMEADPDSLFPSGKRQRRAVLSMCDGCPMVARNKCAAMAARMQLHDREGKIVGGATGPWGGEWLVDGVAVDLT